MMMKNFKQFCFPLPSFNSFPPRPTQTGPFVISLCVTLTEDLTCFLLAYFKSLLCSGKPFSPRPAKTIHFIILLYLMPYDISYLSMASPGFKLSFTNSPNTLLKLNLGKHFNINLPKSSFKGPWLGTV